MVNRILAGAHYGLRDWMAQRLSAVVMLIYTLLIVLALPSGPLTFESWRGMFAHQWMRIATFIFLMGTLIHCWVGMRNILMDYIKPIGLRMTFQSIVIVALVGYAGWAMQILWRF